MNHLVMSVAPTSLTKALDSVGKDFDGEFKVWKKKLSCHLSREMETKKEVEILRVVVRENRAGPKDGGRPISKIFSACDNHHIIMITNGSSGRNFLCFISEIDHPPLVLGPRRPKK